MRAKTSRVQKICEHCTFKKYKVRKFCILFENGKVRKSTTQTNKCAGLLMLGLNKINLWHGKTKKQSKKIMLSTDFEDMEEAQEWTKSWSWSQTNQKNS